MKEIPISILQRDFYLKVKPEVKKIGALRLTVSKPEGFETAEPGISIDDVLIENPYRVLTLDSGIHTLKAVCPPLSEENISFSIEPGKTLDLNIALKQQTTGIFFDLSSDTIVYIDGKKVDLNGGNMIPVTEGAHTLRVKIGEYSINKKILVKTGKKYTISLIFDLDIKEN
jgi:hypothetical protein